MNQEKKSHIIRAVLMGTLGGVVASIGVMIAGMFMAQMISSTKPDLNLVESAISIFKFTLFGSVCGLIVGVLSKPAQPKHRKVEASDDFESEVSRKVQQMIDKEQGKTLAEPVPEQEPDAGAS